MVTLKYDGSFEGFLSAVFAVYERKLSDVKIVPDKTAQPALIGMTLDIEPEEQKAKRVWEGLKKKLTVHSLRKIYWAFLSEETGIENVLLAYCQYVFSSPASIESDYGHPAVAKMSAVAKSVYREKHRMEAFVRFQLTADQLYYAVIEPDFNVLPLIEPHFRKRYADQRWVIYDTRRKYGLYYDLQTISNITIQFSEEISPASIQTVLDPSEQLYQDLWKLYFDSVNIKARKNMKLHIQHMPRRYWKYLIEKQAEG